MPRISEILSELEKLAPKRFTFEFDKVGLQVGEEHAQVTRAAYALDRSLGAIEFAKEKGCQLLLAHHPLIFTPLDEVTNRSHTSRSALELARNGIAFIAAHTNWDSAQGGINDVLCDIFELTDRKAFGSGATVNKKKLVVFCPNDSTDRIIDALSEAGAGVIGAYRRCAFRSSGEGSFIGDETTNPTIGEARQLTSVEEIRLEMVVPAGADRAVEKALLKAHPYETPAYDFYPLAPAVEQPAGRMGVLTEPVSFREFVSSVDTRLATKSYAWGDPENKVKKIGIVGGAADGDWMHAQRIGADVFLTGEVRQHIAVEAGESGMCVIAAGHYATENPGAQALGRKLAERLPEIEWLSYEPAPGFSGRPFHL